MTEQQLSFGAFVLRQRPVEDVRGLSRGTDPETSQNAAQRISGRTERLIVAVMGANTWTADELCAELPNVYPPTLKSALSRLKNHRLIVECGTRLSARGLPSTVWKLSERIEP